ncbi:MAG: ATP-binding protein [Bacteroidetes bacterium]|nr:ATP-binding protein [Bacteroidota bacterium]MDA0843317.1 ATP-binding protein [Bacteroidota bacterium]
MINKRLLVKNLLAHNDENSFYDKKRFVSIGEKEGKAKFLKHICALANSNPANNSFIVVGVEDHDNSIVGVDFFDDSKIQNLVNAYLDNPPKVSYENIPFPHLPENKVVGLVTIRSSGKLCSLRKNIWKYYGGAVFYRDGSVSAPKNFQSSLVDSNSAVVQNLERHSENNIELTLDGVIDFIRNRHPDLSSDYKVFKEQFVVCWAGQVKKIKDKKYYSRVDIELINEQVRLFYSALDEIEITYTNDTFSLIEYVYLGLGTKRYYPLERLDIRFEENGTYQMNSELLFDPPRYDTKELFHVYNTNNTLVKLLTQQVRLSDSQVRDLRQLPDTYLICYLNGFEEAKEQLELARPLVKDVDSKAYSALKEALRVMRKVRYN